MKIDFRLRLSNHQKKELKDKLKVAEQKKDLPTVKHLLALIAYSEGTSKKQIAKKYQVKVEVVQKWIRDFLLDNNQILTEDPISTKSKRQTRIEKTELKKLQAASMFVHDFRKPFNQIKSILSSFELFQKDPLKLQAAREDIEQSIKNAESMISDILDFTKEYTICQEPVSLIRILDFIIRQTSLNFKNKRISFSYRLNALHQPLLDESRMARALGNIVENAFEAIIQIGKRNEGHVWFHSKEIKTGNLRTIELTIGNDGPPLKAAIADKMFALFYTSGKSTGTGLGLASANKIINLHQGTISSRNLPEEKGVEFIITLPASIMKEPKRSHLLPPNSMEFMDAPSEGTLQEASKTLQLEKRQQFFKILLLEDEVLYRVSIRNLIEEDSTLKKLVTLYDAGTIKEAFDIIQSEEIQYAIVDINLAEEENGLNFLKLLKYENVQIPSLIHSGNITPQIKKQAQELGVEHFKQKPLTKRALVDFLLSSNPPVNKEKEEKFLIYCCDDSEIMRMHVGFIIDNYKEEKNTCIKYHAFETGEALLELARDVPPDLVFTDLHMEETGGILTGYNVIEEMLKIAPTCQVFLLSNSQVEENLSKVLALGGKGALEVPLKAEDLVQIMESDKV